MQTVTVKYGVESFTKNYESTPTFGQIASDPTLKAVLGFGDNVRTLLDGVEQPRENLVPFGAHIRIETRANSKAGLATIKIGSTVINKDVELGFTAEDVLDMLQDAGLIEDMDKPRCQRNGVPLNDEAVIEAGDVVEIVDAEADNYRAVILTVPRGTPIKIVEV